MIAPAPSFPDVQTRLQAVQAEIVGSGVRPLALFGSVCRDTARPDSDVNLLVELEPGQKTLPHILADALDVVRAA